MSIEIKLTDQHLPISPVLVDFLYRFLENQAIDASWQNQRREKLSNNAGSVRDTAQANLSRVLSNPVAINTINRSYDLMMSIMFGLMDKLSAFQQRHKFILVVGIPRSGGSYLTRHLFKSIGIAPAQVPRTIAHDGFPNPMPFQMTPQYNPYTTLMRQTAEYLAMAELFFGNQQAGAADSTTVVPKKTTQAAYHGAFFREIMGPDTECLVTLRHPVAACISTYEKSGGLPKNGKFTVRSNIEDFAQRASLFTGISQDTINSSKYFDIYLHYWETYHNNLATTGLLQPGNHTIVCYGEQAMQTAAADLYTRFSGTGTADRFRVKRKTHKHPGWNEKANAAIERVAAVWSASGIGFPEQQLLEAW